MELNYLKEFVVLADIGNYMEAADHLYISQSALSRHIKTMENELGTILFERTTRKIKLSKFGEIFYPYAQQIAQINTQYQTALHEYKKNFLGTLSIGTLPSMAHYNIIDLLLRFQQEYPNFSLNLIENDSMQLIDMVRRNELELAFIRSAEKTSPDFIQIEIAEDPLAAILPASHKLAGRKNLMLTELAKEKLILLSNDTFMYHFCVNECNKAGFEPKIGYTGKRGENILAMVEKGAGIALLTRTPLPHYDKSSISVVEITPSISTWVSLVYRKDKNLSQSARQFIAMIKSP